MVETFEAESRVDPFFRTILFCKMILYDLEHVQLIDLSRHYLNRIGV